ncbi:hypothetical protein, partial [Frankia sp. Cr1]|uniref:hypothetical protein n=1 Tax=Frankia sp. Cr1 TaxID=3073931 RepID=UPI002AD4A21D
QNRYWNETAVAPDNQSSMTSGGGGLEIVAPDTVVPMQPAFGNVHGSLTTVTTDRLEEAGICWS